MSAEQNKAIVRRWVEGGWNGGDLDLVDELYAQDYTLNDPAMPVHGREGFKQYVTMYRSVFPDLRFTLEDLVAEGDKVAWRLTARGTHKGALMGIPPTDKQVAISAIVVSRFDNGKWAEDWLNIDMLGMLQQIGAIPAPGQAS
jgi:steroid delta-isomerase-like uncharacterized protein